MRRKINQFLVRTRKIRPMLLVRRSMSPSRRTKRIKRSRSQRKRRKPRRRPKLPRKLPSEESDTDHLNQ